MRGKLGISEYEVSLGGREGRGMPRRECLLIFTTFFPFPKLSSHFHYFIGFSFLFELIQSLNSLPAFPFDLLSSPPPSFPSHSAIPSLQPGFVKSLTQDQICRASRKIEAGSLEKHQN